MTAAAVWSIWGGAIFPAEPEPELAEQSKLASGVTTESTLTKDAASDDGGGSSGGGGGVVIEEARPQVG